MVHLSSLEETFSRDFLSKCKSTPPPLSPYPLPSSRNLQKSKKTIDHHPLPPPFPKDTRFSPKSFPSNFLISNRNVFFFNFQRRELSNILPRSKRANSIEFHRQRRAYTIQKRIRNGVARCMQNRWRGAVERLI